MPDADLRAHLAQLEQSRFSRPALLGLYSPIIVFLVLLNWASELMPSVPRLALIPPMAFLSLLREFVGTFVPVVHARQFWSHP